MSKFEIIEALEVLGINPADVLGKRDGAWEALENAARIALTAPVTAATPPGTEIRFAGYDTRYWFVGRCPIDSEMFVFVGIPGSLPKASRGVFDGPWLEVQRPTPIPVEVGQIRLMPAEIIGVSPGQGYVGVEHDAGGRGTYARDVVESWAVQSLREAGDEP